MELRTEIQIPPFGFTLNHRDKIGMMGSCFVENISSRLEASGFNIDVNPFGVVYNPFSIANGLNDLVDQRVFTSDDLIHQQGLYHSFSHHSRFSDVSSEKCLQRINERIGQSLSHLRQSSLFIVTFGSAFVYRLKEGGEVVANCHKMPDSHFVRQRMTVGEIVDAWKACIERLRRVNPAVRVLFTVSPIRHLKDGLHENQLSKATLLLAVDELVKILPECYYFPAYELLMDDLRDYRFYADDMLHPSALAVDYIWEKFSSVFFSDSTLRKNKEWQDIQKAFHHRPLNPDSEEYKRFIEKAEQRKEAFMKGND